MKKDPRIDAYIASAQPFARPMLKKLRAGAHAACPDAEETLKWGIPALIYRGKILCGLGAFKAHCAFFVFGKKKDDGAEGMGEFGKMTSLKDLPSDAEIRRALNARMAEIDAGPAKRSEPNSSSATKPVRPAPAVPPDLSKALKTSRPAATTFEKLAPSHRRDYIGWITSAKQEATRSRRLAQAIEWLAEGKTRNWKYERR